MFDGVFDFLKKEANLPRLNVNPTRMEMARLKNKLRVAVKGYKLLKDKSDEMTRQFLRLSRQNHDLRTAVEARLMDALRLFHFAQIAMTEKAVAAAVVTNFHPKIGASTASVMGLVVPKLECEKVSPGENLLGHENANLDKSFAGLAAVLPELVNLAAVEKTCDSLAADIEKTRRRINALEFIMIPDTRETIKYIQMKLGENERQNQARIMRCGVKSGG